MRTARVEVRVPGVAGHEAARPRLVVRLERVAEADARAEVVSSLTVELPEQTGAEPWSASYDLPLGEGLGAGQLEVSARLLFHEGEELRPGDLTNARAVPVGPDRPGVVDLVLID